MTPGATPSPTSSDQPLVQTVAAPSPVLDPASATATPAAIAAGPVAETIALSASGRPITAYRFGSGPTPVVIVGGMHGGYEWNSILLADQLRQHYRDNPESIPAPVTLHLIPNANPDGLFAVTGFDGPFEPADIPAGDPVVNLGGRFNGNGIDLNRNWDCNWTATALWRDQEISGGASPFSEPEARGLRDYLLALQPAVVIFLHSAAGAVYVSGCPTPHPPSRELSLIYGQAAGYPVREFFDHYAITGDAGDWLTTQGIPSFSVELFTHESLDWEENLAGMSALLRYFDQQAATPTTPSPENEGYP
jgi:hypothetical protein